MNLISLKKYVPDEFVNAWKHIHLIFSEKKVLNVALVWCACPAFTGQNAEELTNIMKYYPGDQYVDWWGICLPKL